MAKQKDKVGVKPPSHSLESAVIDEKGREINNPVPLVIDVGPRPLTLREQIKRLIVEEGDFLAKMEGTETFEEADDFDVPEETGDIHTQYTQMEPDITAEEWAHIKERRKSEEAFSLNNQQTSNVDKESIAEPKNGSESNKVD